MLERCTIKSIARDIDELGYDLAAAILIQFRNFRRDFFRKKDGVRDRSYFKGIRPTTKCEAHRVSC